MKWLLAFKVIIFIILIAKTFRMSGSSKEFKSKGTIFDSFVKIS